MKVSLGVVGWRAGPVLVSCISIVSYRLHCPSAERALQEEPGTNSGTMVRRWTIVPGKNDVQQFF